MDYDDDNVEFTPEDLIALNVARLEPFSRERQCIELGKAVDIATKRQTLDISMLLQVIRKLKLFN